MSEKTPGQAAYEAWQDVLMRSVPQIQAIPWDDLTEDAHVRWADEERRINELSALIAEREPLAVRSSDDVKPEIMQLRRVLTEMLTCAATGDAALFGDEQLAEWRKRAGITS